MLLRHHIHALPLATDCSDPAWNMATMNWRTINIDLLDPESPANFAIFSLSPAAPPVSASEVQSLSSQIKQFLRGGDSEGALRGALENPPYGGDAAAKVSSGVYFCETVSNRIRENRVKSQRMGSVHGDSETDHCSGVGSAPSHRGRDPSIHQTVRDVANA